MTGYIVRCTSTFSSSLLTILPPCHNSNPGSTKFCAMTDVGSLLHLNARCSFCQATERLDGLTRSVPDDKDELAKDQEIWVQEFGKAMVSQSLFDDSRS